MEAERFLEDENNDAILEDLAIDGLTTVVKSDLLDDPEMADLDSQEAAPAEELDEEEVDTTLKPQEESLDTLQIFLNNIIKIPLLKGREEEVEIAKRYEAGLQAKTQLEELQSLPDSEMDDNQLAELDRLIKDGQAAKDLMINANLRLVVSIAKKYRGHGMDFGDLIQEGTKGLVRSVEKFDHRKGFKFSTYATWWIKQAVQRGMADKARTIRHPVHIVEKEQKIDKARKNLTQSLNRDPTPEEIAAELGLKIKDVKEVAEYGRVVTSLNSFTGDDEETELINFFEGESEHEAFEEAALTERRDAIRIAVMALPERERRVIELRFGFEDGENWTLEAIGHELDITRERVRQLEGQALRRLSSFKELQIIAED